MESFKMNDDDEILNNYLYIDLNKPFRKLIPSHMAGKNKKSENEEPTENKKDTSESRVKTSIKKLKKLRSEIVKNKEKLEKKLRKLLDAEGKEQKAERVNAKLEKVVKKEHKVFEDIMHKKEDRKKRKEQEFLKKDAKAIKKSAKELASAIPVVETILQAAEISSISEKLNKKKPSNKTEKLPSKQQPAKTSIKVVRRMTDIKEIENFMKGEKRVTVVQAANSRKNRLAKNLK
jgi:hypothetical protein